MYLDISLNVTEVEKKPLGKFAVAADIADTVRGHAIWTVNGLG